MRTLVLSGVTVTVTAVIYDSDTDTAEPVQVPAIPVAARDWPAWAVEVFPGEWAKLRKQVADA
jgi:hypothetical protein